MTATRLTTLLHSIACITLLTGCVGSVHPLYVAGEAVFREELLGEYYILLHDGAPTIWKVESIDDEYYRVTFPPKVVDEAGLWIMHVVELDGQLYIDLRQEVVEEEAEANEMPPVHIIARLRFEDDTPITSGINQAWLDDYIADHPDELAVERKEGMMLLITAATEELQQFITSHADEGLFDDSPEGFGQYTDEVVWTRHDP